MADLTKLEARCLDAWRKCALSKLPQTPTPEELVRTVLAEAGVAELVKAASNLLDEGHSFESEGWARSHLRAVLTKVQS